MILLSVQDPSLDLLIFSLVLFPLLTLIPLPLCPSGIYFCFYKFFKNVCSSSVTTFCLLKYTHRESSREYHALDNCVEAKNLYFRWKHKQTKQNISPGMAKTYPSLELFKMGEVKVYWYVNKLIEEKKPRLRLFADFHGVNSPTLTSFKLWFNNQVTSPEYLTVDWNHFQQTFVHVLNSTWTSTWWGHCSTNENGPSQRNVSFLPRNRNSSVLT